MIRTQALGKHYGRLAALDECSLEVPAGEVFGLLGPNGAGKTTLIRLLLGYLRPTAGQAWIHERDCRSQSREVHRLTSYLPGEVRLFRWMTGRGILKFVSEIRGQNRFPVAEAIAERLKVDTSRWVAACSSGMRQKLALATVFAADTPVLILDEPTTHLDPTARAEVLALVREARDSGRTVLFSSHVLSEVEDVCDRVAVLRGGRLVHTQLMSELRSFHRLQARLKGPVGEIPPDIREELTRLETSADRLLLETPGELTRLFGWLAGLPLADVKIEPLGLRAIYEKYHQLS